MERKNTSYSTLQKVACVHLHVAIVACIYTVYTNYKYSCGLFRVSSSDSVVFVEPKDTAADEDNKDNPFGNACCFDGGLCDKFCTVKHNLDTTGFWQDLEDEDCIVCSMQWSLPRP